MEPDRTNSENFARLGGETCEHLPFDWMRLPDARERSRGRRCPRCRRGIRRQRRTQTAAYLSWSAILATPALAQLSSPSVLEPLTPIAPIVSAPIFIGMPPFKGITS